MTELSHRINIDPSQFGIEGGSAPEANEQQALSMNEQLKQLNQSQEFFVPHTIEEGEAVVADTRRQAEAIIGSGDSYMMHGEPVDTTEAEKLLARSDEGLLHWRVSPEARTTGEAILQTKDFAELPDYLQEHVLRFQQLECPADKRFVAFNKYKQWAKQTLAFDEQLAQLETAPAHTTEADPVSSGTESTKTTPEPADDTPKTHEEQKNTEDAKHSKGDEDLNEASAGRAPKRYTRRDNIADLVDVDARGIARYSSGVKLNANQEVIGELKGKRMSKHELDLIEEHQDMIRDGLADLQKPAGGKHEWTTRSATDIRELLGKPDATTERALLADELQSLDMDPTEANIDAFLNGKVRVRNGRAELKKPRFERIRNAARAIGARAVAPESKHRKVASRAAENARYAAEWVGYGAGLLSDATVAGYGRAKNFSQERVVPKLTEKLRSGRRGARFAGRVALSSLTDLDVVRTARVVQAQQERIERDQASEARKTQRNHLKRARNSYRKPL